MTALTIHTFRDEAGRHHPAVVIARTALGRRSYALAVSDRPGLIVLEERLAGLTVVRDAKVLTRVQEALGSLVVEDAEPALVFRTRDGRQHAATRAVAHRGRTYLLERGGRVFEVGADDAEPVADPAMARRVREIAATEEARLPEAITLNSGGDRRELDLVREARVGASRYAIAIDRADPQIIFALRADPGGTLTPVTDAVELERVRAALSG